MARWFNTAGPCRQADHYMLPALRRLPEVHTLIEQRSYFVLHAPRQVGKTTSLRALAEQLTASGRYAALHFSCEEGEAFGDDVGSAQRALLRELALCAGLTLPAELRPPSLILEGDEGAAADQPLRLGACLPPAPGALLRRDKGRVAHPAPLHPG